MQIAHGSHDSAFFFFYVGLFENDKDGDQRAGLIISYVKIGSFVTYGDLLAKKNIRQPPYTYAANTLLILLVYARMHSRNSLPHTKPEHTSGRMCFGAAISAAAARH